MVPNYTDMPIRMRDIWKWIVALDAFDYGDRKQLADMLADCSEVPEEVIPQLARIVSGERKPNLKAAAKLKIPASERMKIAGTISTLIGLADMLRTRARDEEFDRSAVEKVADREGKEVIEVYRYLDGKSSEYIQDAAEQMEVSVETIENLLRDLRKKIEIFPII